MWLWKYGGVETKMKIIVEDQFGSSGKLITIHFNTELVIEKGKKILRKGSIGPVEISERRFNELKTMYQDDVTNGTYNLYQLLRKKVSATNPRVEIILGDDPELDKNGVLIDQNLNPQIDL